MIRFTLNGETVETDLAPDTPLLWAVRDEFGLKGSKFGCGAGLCGACTMHVDGEAARTCILPIAAVNGRAITTIEGLGGPDGLDPVQQAFLDHNALQCGFCTPGFILSVKALLHANPAPSHEEIVEHLNGNLCRCTGYHKIIDAVESLVRP